MDKLGKLTFFAQLLYGVCGVDSFTQAQEPAKAPVIVNGMMLVALDGPYRYNSGGVPLYGFITASKASVTPTGKATFQATDQVEFLICKTGKEITVKYSDLAHAQQECPTTGRTWPETAALWPEWKINSGKLVVKQNSNLAKIDKQTVQGLTFKDISISDLPEGYQSALSSVKQGKTVAVTVPAGDGRLLLGILPDRYTGGAM